jgi:hypothetical protein
VPKPPSRPQTSGIVPRQRPSEPASKGTPGLGRARHQLKTQRGDSMAKKGKKGC